MSSNSKAKHGFSLIEVMIGTLVFALVSVGVASATLQTGRIAYSNVYRNTAFTVAQGFSEQIKSIPYIVIDNAFRDPALFEIPTKSLSFGASGTSEIDDYLVFNERMLKEIVIDVQKQKDGTLKERVMKMWITPKGRDLTKENDELKVIEITLEFEWELVMAGFSKMNKETLKFVKTDITEY